MTLLQQFYETKKDFMLLGISFTSSWRFMAFSVKVLFTHVRPHTALVCHTNRYWHSSVSSMNSGMPTPAVGLQWNMMVEYAILVFSRPHVDSEGTITSRFPPDGRVVFKNMFETTVTTKNGCQWITKNVFLWQKWDTKQTHKSPLM